MNLQIFHAFSDELQKTASLGSSMASKAVQFGGAVERPIVETAKIMRDSAHPGHLREGLKKGLRAMSNAPGSRKGKELAEKLRHRESAHFDPRNVFNQAADFVRSPEAAARSRTMARDAEQAHKYTADFHTDPSISGWARRQGLLSNAPKYEGSSSWRKARNTAARALPGETAVVAPLLGNEVYTGMQAKKDPLSGKVPGVGERVGRTALGLTTGIVGMRGGLVTGTTSALLGHEIGARTGRALDTAGRKIKSTVTGAAPHPTGAN